MRTLVSVQRIVNTAPIPDADKIVTAQVLGWQCVTQKANNFNPGDLVVYFEIDSLIPLKGIFEFLRKKETDTHHRLKTIRLRGQIAQGLILPLSDVAAHLGVDPSSFVEGQDLTAALGVVKYEAPDPEENASGSKSLGLFPGFVSKTDETRLQAIPWILEKVQGTKMFATEKLDGSSITIFWVAKTLPGLPKRYTDLPGDFVHGVASRNLCVDPEEGTRYSFSGLKELQEAIEKRGQPLVLQGEIIGPGIQKNKYKLTSSAVRWFNAVDPVTGRYFDFDELRRVLDELNAPMVPVVHEDLTMDLDLPALVELSKGSSVINKDTIREGLVFRPHKEANIFKLGRLSFKVINPEFLIKYDA